MPVKKQPGGSPSSSAKPASRRTRGSSSNDEDGADTTSNITGKGWGAVIERKKQSDAKSSKNRPPYLDIKNKFWLSDGETAIVQFLNDAPLCVIGAMMPPERRDFYVSAKSFGKRHCPMFESGLKETWRAGFKLLDQRGKWNKDTKRGENVDEDGNIDMEGEPVEVYWLCSQQVSSQLFTLAEKRKKKLSELVVEVTRVGGGTDTIYQIGIARDDEDEPYEPLLDWEEKLPSLEEALKPLPDAVLNSLMGKSSGKDVAIDTSAE